MKHPWGSGNLPICFILTSPFAKVKQIAPRHRLVCRTQAGPPASAGTLPALCMNAPVPHRFLEFCKENGGYTGCPFPAKLDLQQGQNLLQDLSKLSPSTSGNGWARVGQKGGSAEEGGK